MISAAISQSVQFRDWTVSMKKKWLFPRLLLACPTKEYWVHQATETDSCDPFGFFFKICNHVSHREWFFQRISITLWDYLQMGPIRRSRVVKSTQKVGKPMQISPVNIEWGALLWRNWAHSSAIPQLLFFNSKLLNERNFQQSLPSIWKLAKTWINELKIKWRYDLFRILRCVENFTRLGRRDFLFLKIMRHTTAEFRDFCKEHNIILLWMLSHTLHLLQRMYVGDFGKPESYV